MRVLVTRPESEARQWVEELRQKGFDAQPLPLIEIAAVADVAPLAAAWRHLDQFRAVMFVSGNAARHFFAARPDAAAWPERTRAWSPGAGTRQVLLASGLDSRQVDSPGPESAQFDSETLWREVAGQVTAGDTVLIVRGADAQGKSSGRDWLADQLTAAGARVQVLPAYRREPPRLDREQLALASDSGADSKSVWLFSSSEAIANLRALLPQRDWAAARALATHPRIAQAARGAGFGVVCESRPALSAVVAALESIR
jgi:uroporphyrinogen-III synthase